jgi:hypothetical protein
VGVGERVRARGPAEDVGDEAELDEDLDELEDA